MAIHSISNTRISVVVTSLGAELISLKDGETELMWQADKNVWARHAPVLFPVVGKLKNNKYKIGNEIYGMPQHGFARDNEFTLVERAENFLEFELTANEDTLKNYPFHFALRIKYVLDGDSLHVKYHVFNPGNKDLLFSLGAHPGFNCKRIKDESLEDFYLEFDAINELYVEKLNEGLLSGETAVLKLVDNKMQLNKELFESDALVFKNTQIETIKLCSRKSKQVITLNCKAWPNFGIWTKKGSDAFVCLEPWFGIADSVSFEGEFAVKEGIICLQPFKYFDCGYSMFIS